MTTKITAKDWYHIANTKLKVSEALHTLFGIDVPEDAGSWKTNCPLDQEHSDGGKSPALRVNFDSNTARCFSHNKTFTPVDLWKIHSGSTGYKKPALEMLEHFGISTKPPTLDERWENTEKDTPKNPEVDLKQGIIFFAQHQLENYSILQYRDDVLELMCDILDALDEIDSEASYETIEEWSNKAKGILKSYWRENGWT